MTEHEKRDVWIGIVAVLVLIILYLLFRQHAAVASGASVASPYLNGPQWAGGAPLNFTGVPNFSPPATPTYNFGNAPGFATQMCACGTNTVS